MHHMVGRQSGQSGVKEGILLCRDRILGQGPIAPCDFIVSLPRSPHETGLKDRLPGYLLFWECIRVASPLW